MKDIFIKILSDLQNGDIDVKTAQNLLLGLFDVKSLILKQLQLEAKEAEIESEKIGDFDRDGGFQEFGRQQGLERAMEIVSQYIP